MADQTTNRGMGDEERHQQEASEGLHIYGRGHEALEDGAEQPAESGQQQGSDDVFGNANIQSGRRSTFEGMIDGQPEPGKTVAEQPPIVGGEYTPQDPEGDVVSRFDAVQPANTARTEPRPDGEDNDDNAGEDEDSFRQPTLERPEDRLPGADNDEGADAASLQPQADPAVAAFPAAPLPSEGTEGGEEPADNDEEEPELQAETPTVSATDASGVEDLPIRLDLSASLTDLDGSETLTITVSGLPDGFSLTDANGTPIGVNLGGGAWSVPPSQLDNVYLGRPEHYSGDVALTVTATATEINGDTSTATTTFTVHVEAVADAPALAAEDAAGTENQWHDLSINANLVDADGSESLTVYVTDVPDGATLDQGTRLTAPVTLADGTVLAAGTWALTPAQAETVRILPPENDSADFTLRVYAETTEAMNGSRAVSGPAEINVDVGVVAPSVTGSGSGKEDGWAKLELSADVNAAHGDESLQVLLENLPDGVLLRVDGQIITDTSGPVDITGKLDSVEVRWDPAANLHSDETISFNLQRDRP